VLPAYDGHRYAPSLLALDGSGKTLVTADGWYSVCVWDVPAKKMKRRLDLGPVQSIDLAADGKSLFVTTRNYEAVLFDLADYSSRTLLSQTHLALRTPDGKHAACVRSDRIEIVDVATGKAVQRCPGQQGKVYALSFSADGSRLLSASRSWQTGAPSDEEGDTVCLCDVKRGKQIYQWNFAPETVALSPDGQLMLAGDGQGRLRRYDPGTGKELAPLAGHQAAIRAIISLHASNRIVSQDNAGALLFWDAASGKELRRFEPEQGAPRGGIALTGDGRILASSEREGTLLLWDTEQEKRVPR
jgi:WD40 repeat protein